MAAKYATWTVPRLKQELQLRGAVVTGRKIDLIDRLLAYDRNQNFREPAIAVPDSFLAIIDWPKFGYRQLTKEHKITFAKLTREQIDGYFLYRLAGDKQATGDIKAIQKGEALLTARRVLACSVQIRNEDVYLSGIVGAAMKKQVTYNYKIKLEKNTGTPVNSDCECPAGKGPSATCKHIAVVLLMLQHFHETSELMIEKSCTEGLQTFHQPRAAYNGQPLKIEEVPSLKRKQEDLLDDPRPEKYRNQTGYNDWVRNAMVNFCSSSSMDLAMRYSYPSADLQAAQKDHDYLPLPFCEYWVDTALKVSEAEAAMLENKTRGQSSNRKWFGAREWRVTASHFGEVCHMTQKRNVGKLCNNLLFPTELKTAAIQHGKLYERKAITKFESVFGVKTKKCGLFVSPTRPYLGASPDALVGEDSIVEVKCPYSGRQEQIKPGKNFKFLEYDAQNNIVLKQSSLYYDQIQGQMFIANKQFCYFIVYTFVDLFVQKVHIDTSYCEVCLLPKLDLFFTKHFRPFITSKF